MATRKVAKKKNKVAKKKSKVANKKRATRSKTKAPWTATQLREYRAIQKRAVTLGKSLTDADFDAKGNPVKAAWSGLLGDLDAWAAKYGVKLSTQEHDPAGTGGTPVARDACPPSFETKPKYFTTLPNGDVLMEQTSCVLRRRTLLGRCVYSCTTGVFTA